MRRLSRIGRGEGIDSVREEQLQWGLGAKGPSMEIGLNFAFMFFNLNFFIFKF